MSSLKQLVNEKIRTIATSFSGTREQRVAVLGAFDTWPYMDFVSRLLAKKKYIAITSRWIYRTFGDHGILRFDIREHPDFAAGEQDFLSTLLDQIISDCSYAIINFSVSAAHFIETDWCFQKSRNTIGIAYARSAFEPFETHCECLSYKSTPLGKYAECKAPSQRTAWKCMHESTFCPFNRQGISKNVVEYFFRSKTMRLFAVENLMILPHLIDSELPPISDGPADRVTGLNDRIVREHESLFKKHTILMILLINELFLKDLFDRASKLKIFALVNTIPELDNEDPRQSEMIKSTVYMKTIEKGYIDLQIVAEEFDEDWIDPCVNELIRIGFLEQEEIEYMPGQQARLVRLTEIGKSFVDWLMEL